ncbi:hypothetical protein BCR44DRAFT_1424892 [Catenaria anguillulae PL171]|uniref:RRM domain-containing protein n=1 Tax=Catenaria anguillulae PL171 TaxID=765915 RepID=A0A1Y2I0H4_9FUNG|nr:hypothetical protein BCR44DRAFT_1424892 [Catenaria anguillulae PL171]
MPVVAAAAAATPSRPPAPPSSQPLNRPIPPPPPPGASFAPGFAPPGSVPGPSSSASSPSSSTNPLAPGFSPDDVAKMCKLFIGNISSGVTDEWIERLLVACGPIKEWKRMRGPDGSLKAFGFVTYTEPMGTVRALECLGEVTGKEAVVIPSLDGGEHKRVLLKLDDDAKKMLCRFQAARGTQPLDLEHDRMTRRRIHETLDMLRTHAGLPPLGPNAMYPRLTSSTISADTPGITPSTQGDSAPGSGATHVREATPGTSGAQAPSALDLDAFVPKSVAAPAKLPKPKTALDPAVPGAPARRRRWDQDTSAPVAPVPAPPMPKPTMQAAGFVALTARAAPSSGVWAAPTNVAGASAGSGHGNKIPVVALTKPLSLGSGGSSKAGVKKFGFGGGGGGRASPSPAATANAMGGDDGDEGDDAGKKKSRLVLLAEQHRLANSDGVNVASMSDHTVLGSSVPWEKVSREVLDAEIAPKVEHLVREFLGESDTDLVDYFVQEIAHCGSAREVVVELQSVFGKDEASTVVAGVWREVLKVAMSG